jgi:ribosomal protein L7/L12
VSEEVMALARDGRVVDAVRRVRSETGAGLVSAKRIVDAAGAGKS